MLILTVFLILISWFLEYAHIFFIIGIMLWLIIEFFMLKYIFESVFGLFKKL